ncbi:MAG: NUDIX domain-containing protein [Flavitalea sp.]
MQRIQMDMGTKIYSEEKEFFVEDLEKFAEDKKVIVAAGGLVSNEEGELLLIFRRGKWDLPKGKLDNNESLETCANREIIEETGITDLRLKKLLIITRHTYFEKGKNILKETHWFTFDSPGKQKLHPQTEEDIEKAEWVKIADLPRYMNNTYSLIKDVFAEAGIDY